MKTNIDKAIFTYHESIASNLREIGKPVVVKGDNPDVDGIDLSVEFDGRLWNYTFDYIFWDKEKNEVMVHYSMQDYSERDDTMYLSELGDATVYLLDAIQWPDAE